MPRYIDAVELTKAIEENQRNTEHHKDGRGKQIHVGEHRHFMKMVYEQPTADVVPREEVETLKDNNEHLAVMLSEAKQDVAREIFAEINAIKKEYASGDIDGNELYVRLYMLEKKYTEEKT